MLVVLKPSVYTSQFYIASQMSLLFKRNTISKPYEEEFKVRLHGASFWPYRCFGSFPVDYQNNSEFVGKLCCCVMFPWVLLIKPTQPS